MPTPFSTFSDDFYINMNLNTEMPLPDNRDTILHFFERVQRQFPTMNSFYQRDNGDFCLDEDRETGSYRWITIERDRISSGYVNPDKLEDVYEQHRLILELAPYALGVSNLDIDSLDVLFGMDFDCNGNHDEILAEALFRDTPFATLLELPHAQPLGFDPSFLFSLSDDCRLQGKISLESRTGAYQIRTNKYKDDEQLSLYLSIRQYPDPSTAFSALDTYDRLCNLCSDIMQDRIIPDFVHPITTAIAQRL